MLYFLTSKEQDGNHDLIVLNTYLGSRQCLSSSKRRNNNNLFDMGLSRIRGISISKIDYGSDKLMIIPAEVYYDVNNFALDLLR